MLAKNTFIFKKKRKKLSESGMNLQFVKQLVNKVSRTQFISNMKRSKKSASIVTATIKRFDQNFDQRSMYSKMNILDCSHISFIFFVYSLTFTRPQIGPRRVNLKAYRSGITNDFVGYRRILSLEDQNVEKNNSKHHTQISYRVFT